MVVLANRPLVGPPPSDLLDPVPGADLVRAVTHGLDSLRDEIASDTRNVVLTLARIWTTVVTGAVRPKDEAADWALDRLPDRHRPVLARARAGYLGGEREPWPRAALPDVVAHVDHVIAEIE